MLSGDACSQYARIEMAGFGPERQWRQKKWCSWLKSTTYFTGSAGVLEIGGGSLMLSLNPWREASTVGNWIIQRSPVNGFNFTREGLVGSLGSHLIREASDPEISATLFRTTPSVISSNDSLYMQGCGRTEVAVHYQRRE